MNGWDKVAKDCQDNASKILDMAVEAGKEHDIAFQGATIVLQKGIVTALCGIARELQRHNKILLERDDA